MAKEVKAATLTVTELVNATEVASIEQSNTNNMEKKEISENGNAANAASNELKSWGKDMGVKPTTVKARINGEVQTIIVAHTEYGMRHDKKMDKMLTTALYMKREIHGFGQSANQSEELQLPGTVGCRKPEEPD